MDIIIRAREWRLLTAHVKSPGFQPSPGGDSDAFVVFHVLGVPDPVSFPDVIDIFGDIDHSAPRFVWTWEDFLRRVPPGPALSAEVAGELVGLAPYTARRHAKSRRLPAYQVSYEGFKGVERPFRFNRFDLQWFKATQQVSPGRPRKDRAGADADGGDS